MITSEEMFRMKQRSSSVWTISFDGTETQIRRWPQLWTLTFSQRPSDYRQMWTRHSWCIHFTTVSCEVAVIAYLKKLFL